MKITKTMDVSHLSDAETANLVAGLDAVKKVEYARELVNRVIKILERQAGTHPYNRADPSEMVAAIRKAAEGNGIL